MTELGGLSKSLAPPKKQIPHYVRNDKVGGCVEPSKIKVKIPTLNCKERNLGWGTLRFYFSSLLFQQTPGFAEAFEAASLLAAVGIEPEIFAVGELDGHDVPEIERDDVGDDGVHLAGGERDHGFLDVDVGMHGVSAMGLIFGGADLHAPEAGAGIEDEVVAVGVSPGLGDAEAEADGFAHEGEFRHLSAAFGWVLVAEVGGRAAGGGRHSTRLQNPRPSKLGRGTRET